MHIEILPVTFKPHTYYRLCRVSVIAYGLLQWDWYWLMFRKRQLITWGFHNYAWNRITGVSLRDFHTRMKYFYSLFIYGMYVLHSKRCIMAPLKLISALKCSEVTQQLETWTVYFWWLPCASKDSESDLICWCHLYLHTLQLDSQLKSLLCTKSWLQ